MLSKLFPAVRSIAVCTLPLLVSVCLAQTTLHVGPGQTYTSIQSGIDAAQNGDTVLVAPGTYNENIDFKGKAITVTSSGGAASTIIDGGGAPGRAVVIFQSNEKRTSVLSNFTIRNGGGSTFTSQAGGGVYVFLASPTILNNVITANECNGIVVYYGAALIQGNTISATSAPGNAYCWEGVALVLQGNQSSPTMFSSVIGNTIENNTAGGDYGAAIFIWGSNGNIIVGNTIRNNVSSAGAVQMSNSESVIFSQNLVYGNSLSGTLAGPGGAGGLNLGIPDGAPPFYGIIINNTFANNTTSVGIGGASQVYIDGDVSKFSFVNNILYGTGSYPLLVCNDAYAYLSPSPMLVENNDVFNPSGPAYDSSCANGSGVAGNISANPLFKNSANDFHLQSGSPAIDTGNNQALAMLTPYGIDLKTDLDGNPRIQDATGKGCIIDMGAYEYPAAINDCGNITETLTSSPNPALAGQSVTFTAQLSSVAGTPTGLVQFFDGSTLLSTQAVSPSGSAAFSTSSLSVGSHTILANYQPTGSFQASTASLVQVINGNPTSTTLTCVPNPIDIFKTAQLTATVTSAAGAPTGSIAFTDNGAPLGTIGLTAGAASLTYTGSIAETHKIVATYTPAGVFAASSATCSEVVNALPTTSTLAVAPATATFGSAVTLTATVAPATPPGPSTPTGVVTFYNGAAALGTGTLVNGVATLVSSSLPGGSYNLTCMYSGSSIYSSSDCSPTPVVIRAAPTALKLTASSDPAAYLSPVTLHAVLTVNGQSAGAGNLIRLSLNGQIVNLTTNATGTASYALPALPPGSYPVDASFAATIDLLASSTSLKEVITPAPTSTNLSATPNPGDLNQGVTLTASIASQSTPVGSGAVTFYDGTTSLGSAPVSATGTASLTTAFTVLGTHNLTAVYDGSADFSTSTSAVFQETIEAGDFTISVTPGSASIYTGQAVSVQVSVASLRGFAQALALTCSGLPANATCSFTPDSLAQGQGAAQLVIQTAAPQKVSAAAFVSGSAGLLAALTLLLLPGKRDRRTYLGRLSVLLCVLLASAGISGCATNAPIVGGTPPGVYQVEVTATTSGAGPTLTHGAAVKLTVKSLF